MPWRGVTWLGLAWAGLGSAGLAWAGLGRGWAGLGWAALRCAGLRCVALGWAGLARIYVRGVWGYLCLHRFGVANCGLISFLEIYSDVLGFAWVCLRVFVIADWAG